MTITFANYRTAIDTPDQLVVGFMVQSSEAETLYALQEGKIYCAADLPRPNVAFDEKGRIWVECDSIPLQAEFIGHYEHVVPLAQYTSEMAALEASVA